MENMDFGGSARQLLNLDKPQLENTSQLEIGATDDTPPVRTLKKDNETLKNEMLKNRVQLHVLSYYLKQQKLEEDMKAKNLNRAIKVIAEHEVKLMQMTQPNLLDKHHLHFAFCFASPLVISAEENSSRNA